MSDDSSDPIGCTCRLCCRILRKCPCVLLIPYLLGAPVNNDKTKRKERGKLQKRLAQKRENKRLSHKEFQKKMDAIRKDQEDRFLKRGKYRQGKGKEGKHNDCDIVDFEEELDREISAAEDAFNRKIAEAEAWLTLSLK